MVASWIAYQQPDLIRYPGLFYSFSAASANNFFLIKKAAPIAHRAGICMSKKVPVAFLATMPDKAETTVSLTAHQVIQ
jgi:hypothetical protein